MPDFVNDGRLRERKKEPSVSFNSYQGAFEWLHGTCIARILLLAVEVRCRMSLIIFNILHVLP